MSAYKVSYRADSFISYVEDHSAKMIRGNTKRITTELIDGMPWVDTSEPVGFEWKNQVLKVHFGGNHYKMRTNKTALADTLREFLKLSEERMLPCRMKEV